MQKAMNRPKGFIIISTAFAAALTIAICAMCSKEVPSGAANVPITPGSVITAESGLQIATEPIPTEPVQTVETPIAEIAETAEASQWVPDTADVEIIAKTLYGECRGVESTTEKAAVAWCILNRVDTTGYACGRSIEYVVTFKNQFQGYNPDNPVTPELQSLAEDVLIRHHNELAGEANVGRILPKEYIYFIGDTKRNFFTTEFLGKNYWDWSLESPYES